MPRAMAASRRKCWPRARRRSFTFLTVLHHYALASGVSTTTAVLPGVPANTIVEAARTERADLIVLGTHGRTGLERVLLGSVAERVVRNAPCAVLTVRQTPDATQGAKPKAAA